MNTIALYIGYLIIGLFVFALIGLLLLITYATVLDLYRVFKYKQTSRFIKKYETRNMYKSCKTAVNFLLSKGISPNNTVAEVLDKIENYRKLYNIKEE